VDEHYDILQLPETLAHLCETFMADVNMFTGGLKVAAMGKLLTANAERQSAMMDEMLQMYSFIMPLVAE